jgi:hypothetical protein
MSSPHLPLRSTREPRTTDRTPQPPERFAVLEPIPIIKCSPINLVLLGSSQGVLNNPGDSPTTIEPRRARVNSFAGAAPLRSAKTRFDGRHPVRTPPHGSEQRSSGRRRREQALLHPNRRTAQRQHDGPPPPWTMAGGRTTREPVRQMAAGITHRESPNQHLSRAARRFGNRPRVA